MLSRESFLADLREMLSVHNTPDQLISLFDLTGKETYFMHFPSEKTRTTEHLRFLLRNCRLSSLSLVGPTTASQSESQIVVHVFGKLLLISPRTMMTESTFDPTRLQISRGSTLDTLELKRQPDDPQSSFSIRFSNPQERLAFEIALCSSAK